MNIDLYLFVFAAKKVTIIAERGYVDTMVDLLDYLFIVILY